MADFSQIDSKLTKLINKLKFKKIIYIRISNDACNTKISLTCDYFMICIIKNTLFYTSTTYIHQNADS